MARIPYVEKESAPPDVRAVYEQIERKFGMVPNVLKAMAVSPGVFKGFVGFLGAVLGEDSIPAPLKELAILTTTKINGCRYCTAHHTMLGTRVGLTSEKIEALPDAGSSVFDEKERAVVRFASEVCERVSASPESIAELRRFFGDSEIATLNLIIGAFQVLTRFADTFKVELEF